MQRQALVVRLAALAATVVVVLATDAWVHRVLAAARPRFETLQFWWVVVLGNLVIAASLALYARLSWSKQYRSPVADGLGLALGLLFLLWLPLTLMVAPQSLLARFFMRLSIGRVDLSLVGLVGAFLVMIAAVPLLQGLPSRWGKR